MQVSLSERQARNIRLGLAPPPRVVAAHPALTVVHPVDISTQAEPKRLAYNELPRWPWLASNSRIKEPRTKRPASVRARVICQIVALEEGVTVAEIKGAWRGAEIIKARDLAIYLVSKSNPDWSTTMLGRFFGGRDHTTIIYALNRFKSKLDGKQFVTKYARNQLGR
jgi:chromosomal replication initiator protein